MRASKSPFVRRATALTTIITLLTAVVIIDGVFARFYFYSNWIRIQTAADAGVTAGSNFLPGNPAEAIATARAYAELNGVRPDEIVSAAVSRDDSAITLHVQRGLPFYLSGAGLGRMGRWIKAEGSAHASHSVHAGRAVQV